MTSPTAEPPAATPAATPAPRSTVAGAVPPAPEATTVGCACCGRLATAEAHLARSATTAAASGFERVVTAYRRHAAGDDDPAPRSIVS